MKSLMLLYLYCIAKVSYKKIFRKLWLRKQLFKTCLGKIYGRKGSHFKENIYIVVLPEGFLLIF